MADSRSLTRISEADYEAIESAVMETERGRWFLKEFARRNRSADTEILLQAISRLEQAVVGERMPDDIDRFRFDLTEMAKAIARSKMEVAAIRPPHQEHSRLMVASEALDSITRTTEQATSDILAAAEHIQEAAWTLREDGADPDLCDDLDRRATEIYTACSFQDLTAQRITKVVQTLRYLEDRITSMIGIWGVPEEDPPEAPVLSVSPEEAADDLTQHDIDEVIIHGEIVASAHEGESYRHGTPDSDAFAGDEYAADAFDRGNERAVPAEPHAEPDRGYADRTSQGSSESQAQAEVPSKLRLHALSAIDALPPAEKLRRFT